MLVKLVCALLLVLIHKVSSQVVVVSSTTQRPPCPIPTGHSLFCKPSYQCQDDAGCPNNLLCCPTKCGGTICTSRDYNYNGWYGWTTQGTTGTGTSRPGTCPGPLYTHCGLVKPSGSNCRYHDDCPGDQLCCSNGCGYTCRSPAYTRSGSCHLFSSLITCPVRNCAADSDCPNNMKCCGFGCCSLPKLFK